MEIRRAYCSATDRNIRVLWKPGARIGDTPSVGDCRALMCLEYGVSCTGAFCPLFDVPVLPQDELLASQARAEVRSEVRSASPPARGRRARRSAPDLPRET